MAEAEHSRPADDWPAETWLRVRVKPGDTAAAIRVRHWLKSGLRTWGIVVEELRTKSPELHD